MKTFSHSYSFTYRCYFLFIWVLINTQSCTDIDFNKNTNSETYLELYMNTDKDDDVYLVDYNTTKSHSYTSVYYNTNDLNRVFWTSVDTFCVYYFNEKICDEIINYSTYSSQNDDGTWGGKQMIYLKKTFKGKQLSVVGCIDENTCDRIVFRVR